MIRRPPRSTPSQTLFPYTTLFRSKQKTAYEIFACDWSSDVCSSDLGFAPGANKSHVAMRQRQVDLNLEEKVAALKGKQKHRRELHDAYRGTASAEQEQPQSAAEAMEAAERDREFFLAMRNEGNM